MRIERTKNTTRGIAAGMVLKVYQMLMPFLMRTAMIHFLGVQYLGLNGLFTSVLHVLNLAELGVGNAMVFSMYKPIAEDDKATICALMHLYRIYYRWIGLFIGVVGLVLAPYVPRLISGDVPEDINIYILYLLNLAATVLSYWMFAYKNCLLQAHQRVDIVSIITIVSNTLQYGLQLVLLILWKNYYLYVLVTLAAQVLNNIGTAIVADRLYPEYHPAGRLQKQERSEINRKIRDIFTGKLGAVILNSVDSIVISAFLGLTVLAVYQNYFYILKSVLSMIEIILASMLAGLGNCFVTESKEKIYKDLEKFTLIFMWLVGLCTCCFCGLYQPFMELWVGAELMLSEYAVICFCIYFFVYTLNRLLNVYKDAAGLWHEDRFRPLITACVNLVLNLLWVKTWGIYGIILSTVVSIVFVGIPWLLRNVFVRMFEWQRLKCYLKQLSIYAVSAVFACAVVWVLCNSLHVNSWLQLLFNGIICLIVPNGVFYIFWRKMPQFRSSIQFADVVTKNRLSLEKHLLTDSET